MFWLFTMTLWLALMGAPFVLLFFLLPSGRECPHCGGETLLIRSAFLRPLRRLVQLRWCLSCGRESAVRLRRTRAPVPRLEIVPEARGGADPPVSEQQPEER